LPSNTTRSTIDKQAGRQRLYVCLLLLPLVLFTLSAFTFTPNTVQTTNQATTTTRLLALQMSALHPGSPADDGCSDMIILEQLSWSEIKLYFNVCALEHMTALFASVGAGAGVLGLISSVCSVCAPIAAWIAAIAAGAAAGTDFLQAADGCGGAILDISWTGGVRLESACSTQDNGS
jgi:hypothetical protein